MDESGAKAEQGSPSGDFSASNDCAVNDTFLKTIHVLKAGENDSTVVCDRKLDDKVVRLDAQGPDPTPISNFVNASSGIDRTKPNNMEVIEKEDFKVSGQTNSLSSVSGQKVGNNVVGLTVREPDPSQIANADGASSTVDDDEPNIMEVANQAPVVGLPVQEPHPKSLSVFIDASSGVDSQEPNVAGIMNQLQGDSDDEIVVVEKEELNISSQTKTASDVSGQKADSNNVVGLALQGVGASSAADRDEPNMMEVVNQVPGNKHLHISSQAKSLSDVSEQKVENNNVVQLALQEYDPAQISHSVGTSSAGYREELNDAGVANQALDASDNEIAIIEKEDLKNTKQANSASDEEQKRRAKRKRRLKRLLRPGVVPSFVALISPDDDSGDEKQPTRVRIDVDEYLGLTKSPKTVTAKSNGTAFSPDAIQSSSYKPADEGWYEGVVPMALPDEHLYLNEFHRVIRSNLEFFSATASDVSTSQAGRRTPVVLGKVGIRCIHCAKAALGKGPAPDAAASSSAASSKLPKMWPAGSISFPVNIAGLYPVVSQKPALHFENCPNLPLSNKTELYRVCQDASVNTKRQRKGGEAKSISTVTYYAVAAKRLGLVDSKSGIRFSRDLALEPLPMEAARAQIEGKQASHRKTSLATLPPMSSSSATIGARITADEDSERVLAEAIAENVDGGLILGRPEDRSLVSDFVFLCVKQMAICHAAAVDFTARGKKTKLMRIGFAGFCCRHCSHIESTGYVANTNFTCRSFSSAPDNLASAISNSFYSHLQKCFLVPEKIKRALAAYKRIHSRQLSRLPHGSQRRLFHVLWTRLRAADRVEAEMNEKGNSASPLQEEEATATAGESGSTVASLGKVSLEAMSGDASRPTSVPPVPETPDNVVSTQWMANVDPESRPVNFSVCKDEETQRILKESEEQDLSDNDNLLLPRDKHLITDFIYLIMKQLRVAHPSAADFARGRRSTVKSNSQAGLCCKHCMEQDRYAAAGRSFPSQADNLASSLNTSLYQHMQKCLFVPDDLKRAMAELKKIHSTQLSHLRFGSQRRFFNILFARLSEVEVQEVDIADISSSSQAKGADDETLASCEFIKSSASGFVCQNCRMVPLELRAAGSFFVERPTEESVRNHKALCKRDSFDLRIAAEALEDIVQACPNMNMDIVAHPSFKTVVRELMGGIEQLVSVFTDGVMETLQGIKGGQRDSKASGNEGMNTEGLWSKFPAKIDFEKMAKAFESFVQDVAPGLDPNLAANHSFVRYFQTISPSLVIPLEKQVPPG